LGSKRRKKKHRPNHQPAQNAKKRRGGLVKKMDQSRKKD